jgi:endonuclease YncB( thermonuclease family)
LKEDINHRQIAEGFAWRIPRHDKEGKFTGAEKEARKKKVGIWADKSPQPPWEYRQEQRQKEQNEKKSGKNVKPSEKD